MSYLSEATIHLLLSLLAASRRGSNLLLTSLQGDAEHARAGAL